jgi:hypothetical protein
MIENITILIQGQSNLFADFLVSLFSGVILALIFFLIKNRVQKKNNITGKWLISETTFSSDYVPYIGMRVWSTANILHSGENISGHGEKVEETTLHNGHLYYNPSNTHTFSLSGSFEWNIFSKNSFKITSLVKSSKETSMLYNLHFYGKNRLEGSYVANAGKSYGTVIFLKSDINLFGDGLYFKIFFVLLPKILRVSLVDNIIHHYIKYYSRSKRVEKKFPILRKVIVAIEDQEFYKHNGFSGKSLLRGLLSQTFIGKKFGFIRSGGSTITMQLARTLFVVDYNKTIRRKIIELFFSYYLENLFPKDERKEKILDLYIVSVRFADKIYGINAASKEFFETEDYVDSVENGIFLIERLSSVSKKYNRERVNMLCNIVKNSGIEVDNEKVLAIYKLKYFEN